MENLLERALSAYSRSLSKGPVVWPDYEKSGVYQFNGRDYVVLRSATGAPLAVYRIRPTNGALRRQSKYPPQLADPPTVNTRLYRKKD